jgi:hypothetical protein
VTNTAVRVFVVILPPLESMEDTRIENLIAELNVLRIRVAHLEAGQEVLDTQRDVDIDVNVNVVALRRGDRIRITNRVKKPATWTGASVSDEERERVATVTRVRPKQVHFVTDNGTRTWRAPNNVRRIER